MLSIGSRAQVMHGNAKKTSGGLTKSQLKYNKQGKIVSKKASALAKKNNRLVKAGYVTRKGVFGGLPGNENGSGNDNHTPSSFRTPITGHDNTHGVSTEKKRMTIPSIGRYFSTSANASKATQLRKLQNKYANGTMREYDRNHQTRRSINKGIKKMLDKEKDEEKENKKLIDERQKKLTKLHINALNRQDKLQGSQKVKLRIHKIETLSCKPYKNSTLYTIQVQGDMNRYHFKYNDIKSHEMIKYATTNILKSNIVGQTYKTGRKKNSSGGKCIVFKKELQNIMDNELYELIKLASGKYMSTNSNKTPFFPM
jgi:hypothetical protein